MEGRVAIDDGARRLGQHYSRQPGAHPKAPTHYGWRSAQKLFFELRAAGRIRTFGGIPGDSQPYGFGGVTARGAVYVVMNPAQDVATIKLPLLAPDQPPLGIGRIQFRDAGFVPKLAGNQITLGPGQMAMVGFGAYAAPIYNFGIQTMLSFPAPSSRCRFRLNLRALDQSTPPPSPRRTASCASSFKR